MTGYIYKVNNFGTWNIKIFKDYNNVPVLQNEFKHSIIYKEKGLFSKTKNLRFKHDYHTSVNFFYVKL